VLRHENRVLRRQLTGRLRRDHAGRLWLTALSGLVNRRRWLKIFPVTRPRSCDGTMTWRELPRSQALAIIACDFLLAETVLLKRKYPLVYI
jgi:hypothetical protein